VGASEMETRWWRSRRPCGWWHAVAEGVTVVPSGGLAPTVAYIEVRVVGVWRD
jgi:hypothetical protein